MSATVVVVEDDAAILELVREILLGEGLRVEGFSSPEIHAIVARARDAALFLIDLMLPSMSGIELAESLRREGFAETPMIAMSASRLMLELATGSELFQQTLPKPFDLIGLLSVVSRHVVAPLLVHDGRRGTR